MNIKLILVCFFYVNCVNAQCYFHNIYRYLDIDTISYDFGFSVLNHNDNFYATGLVQYYTNSSNSGAFTVKTNACGDTLWREAYEYSPVGEERGEVIMTINDTVLCIIGQAYDTLESRREGFILFIDTLSNVLSRKTLDAGARNEIMRGGILVNNEIFIAGYFNEQMPDSNIFLMNTDIDGNILWTKYYGIAGSTYSVLKSIDRAKDGGYILGGSVVRVVGSTSNRNLYLTKTDSLGNKEWTKEYPATYYQGYVLSTSDEGYLLVGNHKPSSNIYWGYVGKMDSAGNVQWQKYFDQPDDPGAFIHAIQSNDGNYLVSGAVLKLNGEVTAYIAKLSQTNGDVIWKREHSYFGGQSHNYIEDLIITAEGDIAATGYVIPVGIPNSTGNDMFIIKLDSCGYLESDSIDAQYNYQQTDTYEITFTDQSQHYCTALWYFGDGDSIYTQNPIHTYSDTGTYTVTLIVRAGNSLDTITQQVVVSGSVGIGNQQSLNNQIKIHPNPATNQITIEITNKQQLQSITLYDITGKAKTLPLVKGELEGDEVTLNIQHLPQGIYLLQIHLTNGTTHTRKIIKQ